MYSVENQHATSDVASGTWTSMEVKQQIADLPAANKADSTEEATTDFVSHQV